MPLSVEEIEQAIWSIDAKVQEAVAKLSSKDQLIFANAISLIHNLKQQLSHSTSLTDESKAHEKALSIPPHRQKFISELVCLSSCNF